MILLIIFSITLLWFFIDLGKYFLALSLDKDSAYLKKYDKYEKSEKSKTLFFVYTFVFSIIKSAFITLTYILIYPFLDKIILVNFILFYLIVISIKIIPEIFFVINRLNLAKKTFMIEIFSSFIEYALICLILSYLMS